MAWLDLVVPSAALLALFGVVALVVVAILQGRKVRRLEDRLADTGDAALEAPLQRIAELQARSAVSEGVPGAGGGLRAAGMAGLAAIVLIAAIGGVWYLFVRDDGGTGATAAGGTTTTASRTTPVEPPTPVDATLVPETVPVLADKSIYTVAVFNASGVQGAAGQVVGPQLQGEGWTTGTIANAPSTRDESVVMWTSGKKRVAWSVAKDLGITRAPRLDGLSSEDIANADVVVLVGLDLANNGAAPTP